MNTEKLERANILAKSLIPKVVTTQHPYRKLLVNKA